MPILIKLIKLLVSAGFVIASASVLVSTVEIGAGRIGIPDSVIASTVVAFGTGLPEISTTIVSVKKGYGALAIGNIMGSNLVEYFARSWGGIRVVSGRNNCQSGFLSDPFSSVGYSAGSSGIFFLSTTNAMSSAEKKGAF